MADYCSYDIHVRGGRAECLMIFAAMPCADAKYVTEATGTKDDFVIHFNSCCKWGLDAYCSENFDGKIDLSEIEKHVVTMPEDEDEIELLDIEELGLPYWYITLRKKSELLNVEIQALSWCEGYYSIDHYKNGELLSSEGDAYAYGERPEVDFDF